MKGFEKLLLSLTTGAVVFIALFLVFSGSEEPGLGGTSGNLAADLATSSTVELGTDSVDVVFATSTSPCSTRTITTYGDPIQIDRFVSEVSATASLQLLLGHLQLASTTVVYDGAEWGCGAWVGTAVSQGSTTIKISETR